MEDSKLRLLALILVNLLLLWIFRQWILSNPDSIYFLLKGLPSG